MTAPAVLDLNRYSVGVGALNGNGTIDDVAGGGTSVLTVGNGAASGTFSGTIENTSGAVSLVVAGSGTETLTGVNTFTGPTTISSGTLNLANAAALSTSKRGDRQRGQPPELQPVAPRGHFGQPGRSGQRDVE